MFKSVIVLSLPIFVEVHVPSMAYLPDVWAIAEPSK